MTRQKFDDLARRIESRYSGRPGALERSTTAWVVLGLAGILSWVGLLFLLGAVAFAGGAMLGGPGVLLLGAGVALFVYGVVQAALFLLVDLTPPDGRALRPGEAPALRA